MTLCAIPVLGAFHHLAEEGNDVGEPGFFASQFDDTFAGEMSAVKKITNENGLAFLVEIPIAAGQAGNDAKYGADCCSDQRHEDHSTNERAAKSDQDGVAEQGWLNGFDQDRLIELISFDDGLLVGIEFDFAPELEVNPANPTGGLFTTEEEFHDLPL